MTDWPFESLRFEEEHLTSLRVETTSWGLVPYATWPRIGPFFSHTAMLDMFLHLFQCNMGETLRPTTIAMENPQFEDAVPIGITMLVHWRVGFWFLHVPSAHLTMSSSLGRHLQ